MIYNKQPIFHENWWLDIVGLNGWEQVEVKYNSNVIVRMPYILKKLGPIKYITQDNYSPYLGPHFYIADSNKNEKIEDGDYYKILNELINKLPKHDIFYQKFSSNIDNMLPWLWHNYDVNVRYTNRIHSENKFSQKTLGSINKAKREGLEVVEYFDIELLCEYQIQKFRQQKIKYPYEQKVMIKIYEEAKKRNVGKLYASIDSKKQIHATNFVLGNSDIKYYLFAASNPNLNTNGSQQICISKAIKEAIVEGAIFDFEGSMVQGIEKFYRGFNPEKTTYYSAKKINSNFLRKIINIYK